MNSEIRFISPFSWYFSGLSVAERFCSETGSREVPGLVHGRACRPNLSVGWLVVGFESNCPLAGPGTIDGMPSVGVFLSDPSPYL